MSTRPAQAAPPHFAQRLAAWFAASPLLRKGKDLWQRNQEHWNMPMGKWAKLQAGLYLILHDYSHGEFPPQFPDRRAAYQAEIDYSQTLPGVDLVTTNIGNMRKPFWFGGMMDLYFSDFQRLSHALQQCGLQPPAKILELGCGHGWVAEFLATAGFEVTATSIVEEDIVCARRRIASIEAKGVPASLRFEVSPMEEVHERVGPVEHYDAVFVFEALHHAYSWREAIAASAACLKKGGWLLLCNEPNLAHTFISYRVAKLSNTHEIGMNKQELVAEMQKCGLTQVRDLGAKLHAWVRPHWLCAQKA